MADYFLTLSSGRKLAYSDYGDPDGEVLFYFHGWPSSRLQGELLDGIGKKHRLRVIATDRPGLGLSDHQPGRKLLDWPPVIEELSEHLRAEKFHALGVSGGGPYVLSLAYTMPERLLSAGVVCGAPPLGLVGMEGLMWPYRFVMKVRDWMPWMLGPTLRTASKISEMKRTSFIMRSLIATLGPKDREALAIDNNYRIITRSLQECMRGSTEAVRRDGDIYSSDWGIDFQKVTYPLQYWQGDLDRNIPLGLAEKFVKMLPNAKLTVFPGEGHYSLPLLRNQEIVEALMASREGRATTA
ncbi:alpha/beta hydrolase [soil metagenome]